MSIMSDDGDYVDKKDVERRRKEIEEYAKNDQRRKIVYDEDL